MADMKTANTGNENLRARGTYLTRSGCASPKTSSPQIRHLFHASHTAIHGSGPESHPDWGGNPETRKFTGEFPAGTPAERKISEFQFRNRMLLRSVMLKHGFKPVDTEWWHFTLENEPYPDTYFDYPVR